MAFGDFTVVRSTVKRVLGSNGLLQEVAINTPAFEFNADGSYKGLLVEPAGTNLLTQSSAFDASPYVDSNVVTTAGAGTGIDGAASAAKVAENMANSTHFLGVVTSLGGSVDSSAYTASFDLKADGRTRVQIFDNNQSSSGTTVFDLSAGTVVSGSGSIEESANGFYRCSIKPLKSTSTTSSIQIRLINTGTNTTYTGDGTSGVLIAFGQIETGSVATSRIVTSGSTVTRGADSVTLTGASSLIGQTEGSMFIEFEIGALLGSTARGFLTISDNGDADKRVNMAWISSSSNRLQLFVNNSGSQVNIQTSTQTKVGIYKVACAYKVDDFAFVVDGSVVGTDSSGTLPTPLNKIDLGQNTAPVQLTGWIRSVAIFPTRLSNAQLQALTT